MSHGNSAPLEKDIQKSIIRWLKTRPRSFTVKLAAGPFSVPGLPDILHIEKGRAYFFETKRPGEYPTKLQAATMEKLVRAGAIVAVTRSLKEVKCLMRQEEHGETSDT